MSSKRRKRSKCEICGLRQGHLITDNIIHFAKFPRNLNRCRKWLRVVGNEELVHLPVEKLCTLKSVCSLHFVASDFNSSGNRLKRHAVPSQDLPVPLTEDQLEGFPQRMWRNLAANAKSASNIDLSSKSIHTRNSSGLNFDHDHTYNTKLFEDVQSCVEIEESPMDEGEVTLGPPREEGPFSWQKVTEDITKESPMDKGEVTFEPPREEGPFSWQKVTEDIDTFNEKQAEEVDAQFCSDVQLLPDVSEPDQIEPEQVETEFSCNVCRTRIFGSRYACVQCADWDLCGACEARGEHAAHYVLRVPAVKTQSETQSVLASLRQILAAYEPEQVDLPEIKEEVQNDDPLAVEEHPAEEAAPADSVGDTLEMQEEYLEINSSGAEDTDVESITSVVPTESISSVVPTETVSNVVPTSAAKRKNDDFKTIFQIKRKCIKIGAQKSSKLLLKEAAIRKANPQIGNDEIIFLNDRSVVQAFNRDENREKIENRTKSLPMKILYKGATSVNSDKIEHRSPMKILYKTAASEDRDKMENLTKSSQMKVLFKAARSEGRDKIEDQTKSSVQILCKAATSENSDKIENQSKKSSYVFVLRKGTKTDSDKMEHQAKSSSVNIHRKATISDNRNKMEHQTKSSVNILRKAAISDNTDKMEHQTSSSPSPMKVLYKVPRWEYSDKKRHLTVSSPKNILHKTATSEDRDKMEHQTSSSPSPMKVLYKVPRWEYSDKKRHLTVSSPKNILHKTATSEDRDKMEHRTESSPVKSSIEPAKSDDQFLLELFGSGASHDVVVNLTKLTEEEILAATQASRDKS